MQIHVTQYRLIQEQAENVIALCQEKYGFPNHPPVPVEMIARALFGLQVSNCKLGQLGKSTTCALAIDDREILVDERCGRNQRNFGIAHEIGHWVLHTEHPSFLNPVWGSQPEIINRMLGSNQATKKTRATALQGVEGNRFAAALLIPHPFLLTEAKRIGVINAGAVIKLAKIFHVSISAMLLRIEELENHLFWEGPYINWPSLDRLKAYSPMRRSLERSTSAAGYDFLRRLRYDLQAPLFLAGNNTGKKVPATIEFSGPPNSGKDTYIDILGDLLEDAYGYKVRVIDEGVNSSLVDKEMGAPRLLKTIADCVSQLQEVKYTNPGDYDIVFFNRGIFDRLALLRVALKLGQITPEQELVHKDYLLSYASLEDIVFLLYISPEVSLKREQESRRGFVAELAEQDGKQLPDQRWHNPETLTATSSSYEDVYREYRNLFRRVYRLDGSDQLDISEQALALSWALLPEDPAQPPLPDFFNALYCNGQNPTKNKKEGAASSAPIKIEETQSESREAHKQLSFLGQCL